MARDYRPDGVRNAADRLLALLHPDGDFSDEERARRQRGVIAKPEYRRHVAGSRAGWTPELRAGLDAVLAKLAAPGMCNPQDETPSIAGEPSGGRPDR